MQRESRKHLEDVRKAAESVAAFVLGKQLEDYLADPLVRAAVERQFQIIGEALRRLSTSDPAAFAAIADAPRIISFRNVLVHLYDAVNHGVVWDVATIKLPPLHALVLSLLEGEP